MLRLTLTAFVLLAMVETSAAACFADYKAKKETPRALTLSAAPLRLHYGVIQLPDAACRQPEREIDARIGADGWTLLSVISIFGEDGLPQRRDQAGDYFLRY